MRALFAKNEVHYCISHVRNNYGQDVSDEEIVSFFSTKNVDLQNVFYFPCAAIRWTCYAVCDIVQSVTPERLVGVVLLNVGIHS